MDPPYQGVCANRDPRYIRLLKFDAFTASLHRLNERQISFILSYDGKNGEKSYGKPMPSSLRLVHIEIDAGRSSQATLLGRNHNTYESIYLSPALVERIGIVSKKHLTIAPEQFSLLAPVHRKQIRRPMLGTPSLDHSSFILRIPQLA